MKTQAERIASIRDLTYGMQAAHEREDQLGVISIAVEAMTEMADLVGDACESAKEAGVTFGQVIDALGIGAPE